MAEDDDFEPRLGRMRSGGGKRARRYLGRVLAAANLARAGTSSRGSSTSYSGSRTGRGAGVGRLLASRGAGYRRVVAKSSIVKLAGKHGAGAAAHLRYLQRDGTTRDGERGALYDRKNDMVEARDFTERGLGDRHQFRLIVSPEDGDQIEDLPSLTRRLMTRVEQDLGTKLDWVAVDHFNTGHPHTHIVVRGVDDRGKDLVIAKDYLTRGFRERAVELVELELGPPSDRELAGRLHREVDQERLTSIDRQLLRDARDLEVAAAHADPREQSLRAGRLAKLARMGLAEPIGAGHFKLQPDMEKTLLRMGERGDIIRTLQRIYSELGVDRAASDQLIYDPARSDGRPITGRVMARGLSDEHADRYYLVVDGVDGRTHYIDTGKGAPNDAIGPGMIVSVTPRRAGIREADRAIHAVATANGGRYNEDAHFRYDPGASDDFVAAHVRRLEAARRGGVGVERGSSGVWTVPGDYLERAAAWEERQLSERPAVVDLLSNRSLAVLESADAATWLDRRLVDPQTASARDAGFGAEVRRAEACRRQWLVEQGLIEQGQLGDAGGARVPRCVLDTLQRRDLMRVAAGLSEDFGLPFSESIPGERIDGIYRRRIDLISGRFALVERSHDFTLVPWRAALDRAEGKAVSGIMRETGASWTIGRGRQSPSIS